MTRLLQGTLFVLLIFPWLCSNAQFTQTVKGGESTQLIKFPGECVYNWVNDNPGIGLAASGTGNILSFKAINDSNGPVTAHIKATPINLGIAYVPSFTTKDVWVVDIAAQKLVKTIKLNDQPYGACVSHDGRFAYVVDGGEVSVISTETNVVVGTIETHSYCYDAVISPDDTKLYVTATNNDAVLVFNTASYGLITSIPCGDFPLGLCISPDGSRLYVADRNVSNVPNGDAVTVINTATNSFVAKIKLGAYREPWGVTISPDGKRVYVGTHNSVAVINAETNKLITQIMGVFSNVFGTIVTPDGSKVYVSDEHKYLTVISTATNTIIGKVPLATGRATGLALTPDGSSISAETGGKLITINIATNQVVSTAKSSPNPNALNNFISMGVTCQPVTYTIIVNSSKGPTITTTDNLAPQNTIYGTPSAAANFAISGNNMKGAILITPPAGIEISTDNVNFSNTLTVGTAGTITATTIYVRISATAPTGSYSGNIALTSDEATTVNVSLPNSVVRPAPLTVTANNKVKYYGTLIEGSAGSTAFTVGGLQNSETAQSVTVTYSAGAAANAAAGSYPGSVLASLLEGGTFNPDNYMITYLAGDIIVNKMSLVITADGKTRTYKAANPLLTVSYAGFVNNEGPVQLTILPVIATSAEENSPPGKYPITVSGAETPDYDISYVPGNFTITALHLYGKIPNAFTPNGDGINDMWHIDDLAAFPNCSVEIFTRYGTMVYRSIGYGTPWQGKFNGADLAIGTYYYVIDLKNGDKPYSGSITIIR